MKKVFNFIITKPIFCLFVVTVVLFIAPAIAATPQSFDKLIVKNIGIDKINDKYEVSLLAYIPKPAQTFSENYQIVSAKGITVNEAMLNIAKLTGKKVALAESNLIIVNRELCEYGVLSALDLLIREYSLGNNSNIFCTDNSKEIIEAAKDIAQNVGISIQDIVEYNKEHVLPAYNYLEEIYAASFSSKVVLMSFVTLEEEGLDSQTPSEEDNLDSDSPSSEETQSSQPEKKKRIANKGAVIILKNGKAFLELPFAEVFALAWGGNINDFGLVQLIDYNNEIFTDAKLSFFVFRNNAKIKTKFDGDLPVCEINISPRLVLDEVEQEQLNYDFYHRTYNLGSHGIIEDLNAKIGKDFSSILRKILENKCDIFDFYENFNANHTKKFQKFLKDFEEVDDFLTKIEVRINVSSTLIE